MQLAEKKLKTRRKESNANPGWDVFAMDGDVIIQEEDHLGVINGKVTTSIPYLNVIDIKGIWAPPYLSSNFFLEGRVFGEKVRTEDYTWRPFQVNRTGKIREVAVSSKWSLIYGHRAGLLTVVVENKGDQPAPVELMTLGWLNREEQWGFATPKSSSENEALPEVEPGRLVLRQGDLAIAIGCHGEDLPWEVCGNLGIAKIMAPPGKTTTLNLVVSIGPNEEAKRSCEQLVADPEGAVQEAHREYERRVSGIFDKVPQLVSSNERLVNLYNRSLFPFLLNRWEVPDFKLNPYYSTGGMNGGCVGGYLWDIGEIWGILPLYEPGATKEHIKQFLRIDITQHFLFDPLTGEAGGPWYMVNQEKIIGLTYRYVAATGDVDFLSEVVGDRTVLDHMMTNAMFGDNVDEPQHLIDYGPSESHLELRRAFTYNHVSPDLNGRRYANYLQVSRLCDVAGKPAPYLLERAEQLKQLLKERLWDSDNQWLWSLDEQGEQYSRYTIQMYKLFGNGVLDQEMEEGLLSHMNDQEFLSEYGLHSMSKKDISFDQLDIDNGGGGICIGFPAQIIEKFCRAGYTDEASDILERILWWAELMPYWGDSIAANCKDYRHDTPLQSSLEGAAIAQCIIYGIFGVDPRPDGTVEIKPISLDFSPCMSLKGLKLNDAEIDISVDENTFRVKCGDQSLERPLGESILLDTSKKSFQ